MPTIHLTTFIAAPVDVVFDLSRHVAVHKDSMTKYKADAVAATRFGLIEKDDSITWKARHLFKKSPAPGKNDRDEQAQHVYR